MAHTSSIFDSQPIRVQNVNGFDLSHINCGTALCGTLTPGAVVCLCLGRSLTSDVLFRSNCLRLATSFFGRIDAHIEGFLLPLFLIYGGWKQFISGNLANMFPLISSWCYSSTAL